MCKYIIYINNKRTIMHAYTSSQVQQTPHTKQTFSLKLSKHIKTLSMFNPWSSHFTCISTQGSTTQRPLRTGGRPGWGRWGPGTWRHKTPLPARWRLRRWPWSRRHRRCPRHRAPHACHAWGNPQRPRIRSARHRKRNQGPEEPKEYTTRVIKEAKERFQRQECHMSDRMRSAKPK